MWLMSTSPLRLSSLGVTAGSLAALVAVFMLTSSASAQWQQSTGTAALNFQSLISRGPTVFAGGATGAYRSENNATSFTFSNSGNSAVGPTRGFASEDTYIYTCTSQGVFRSANNGVNWILKSTGLTSLLSHGILQVQSKLFLVGPTGAFRSDNQGDSWTAAGMAGIDTRCITAIDSTLFVGTNGTGVYKSTNWGASWTAINTGLASTNIRAIEAKGTTLFAGGQIGTGVYRSTDLGANWTLLAGGLATGSYRGFAHDDRLIVAGSLDSPGIHRRSDEHQRSLSLRDLEHDRSHGRSLRRWIRSRRVLERMGNLHRLRR